MNGRAWVVVAALAVACGKGKGDGVTPQPSAHVDEAPHEGIPTRVRVPPNVVADAKLRTAPATRSSRRRSGSRAR